MEENMNTETLGIDHTGTWTPAQYAIDAGWDFSCIEATAIKGVSKADAEGLTEKQQSDLLEFCQSRVEESKARATDFSEYTAQIYSDASYYGSNCTQDDADRITSSLSAMIRNEFPGINVRIWTETIGGSAATLGPDQEICDEVDQWISKNWTSAL